ncbi:MAG: restriction endonuclease subunit S, partial [Muribaculaceae bacterium]|nr:restriction endonuclease subunit S [Muribaculaceae bacterium]
MAENKQNKRPNVPPLRFPEFTEPWEPSTLQEIAEFSKGTGISKEQRSETGLPCILYGELYTTYSNEVIEDVVSRTDLDPTDLVKSQSNDVIIPSSGETAEDIATARCVTDDNVLLGGDINIIRLNEPHDGRFMSYQLNGIRKYDIAKIAQGVSVVHLYSNELKKMSVSLPQSAEQKKIANFLGLLDRRIVIQSKLIEQLESLIKGIIHRLTAQSPNVRIADCLDCYSSSLQENLLNEL